jgi:uncharacterized membrane protein YagU involved in acid resistance
MKLIVYTIISGIVGTAGMTIVMWAINRFGIANADMIRAIGSMFTKNYEDSVTPGFITHFGTGIIISFFYVLIISFLSPDSFVSTAATGVMIGLFHGIVFSFLLVVTVAEHHPLERFRNAGSEVAIAHLVGHLIYGLLVGAMIGITGIRIIL